MEKLWIRNYDNLKLEVQAKRKTGFPVSTNDLVRYQSSLMELETNLKLFQESPMEYEISLSEISRRMVVFDNLRKTIGLLNSSSTKPNVGSLHSPTLNPLTLSDRGLVQRQQEVIEHQDLVLSQIEKGVDRLHSQALEIGSEAKTHVRILDELDRHVDVATEGLREETKHAEQIRRKSNVCYMYICIVIEVIVLLILIILSFTKV